MQTANGNLQKIDSKHHEYEPSLAQSRAHSTYSQFPIQELAKYFQSYTPNHNFIDMAKLHSSPNLKLKKYREAAYYGEIVNGKRHGIGIMVYDNERLYEGEWECDYKHGKGFEKLANGCTYAGYYINGKPEGAGKYSWLNGQFYQGEWLNGLKHGSGMWQGVKGDSYLGEWKFGKADGYGIHTWVNGDRYEGEFKQCLKDGEGIEKFVNGDLYKGSYSKGKPNGYGEYYWASGSFFKGHFKDGMREGQGVWKKGPGNTDKYEGEYRYDKKDGYGIFTWANGNVYKGNYADDLRNQYGEMFWSDGSYYKGEWLRGIQNGEGQLYLPTERCIKRGIFKENVLVQLLQDVSQNNHSHLPGRPKQIKKFYRTPSVKASSVNSRVTNKSLNQNVRGKYSIMQSNSKKTYTNNVRSHPLPPSRADQIITYVSKYKGPLDLKREAKLGPTSANSKKDKIPHSAFYLHKIHKRVSTANNQSKKTELSSLS